MDPLALMLILVAAGAVLLVGELLLPTHGLLGIAGLAAILGAIGVCFYLNRWIGLAVFVTAIVASPFVWTFMISVWMKTPVGKRVMLPPIESQPRPALVRPGDMGMTITEMRPLGECDFDDRRIEARSEHGIIRPGQRIRVVAIDDGRPIVRPVSTEPNS